MPLALSPQEALRALRAEAIALSREARRLDQAALRFEQAALGFVRQQDRGLAPNAGPLLLAAGAAHAQLQAAQSAWAGVEEGLSHLRFVLEIPSPALPPRGAVGGHGPRRRPPPPAPPRVLG